MDFSTFLKQSATEIDPEIEALFATWSKEIAHLSPRIVPLLIELKEASIGGKRIRGALVLLGFQLASGVKNNNADLLKIAVAYEIFQTAVLAHDDISDKSPLRRGKPSLHMALGGDHYGMSQAIFLADLGYFLAFKMIAESTFAEKEKNRAVLFFSQTIHDTVVGQLLDIELSQKIAEASEKDVLGVARLKTAYYTFVGPLTLGAVLGGADDRCLDTIKTFGENIGIAFQIQDDIRDIFGTQEKMKKEIGGDIKEGKNTILILKAREKADPQQLKMLKNYYGNPSIGTEEIEKVKKVFIDTGALDYANLLVKKYSQNARETIAKLTEDKQMQKTLGEGIEYIRL